MNQELKIIVRADGTAQVVSQLQSVNTAMGSVETNAKTSFSGLRNELAMTGLAITALSQGFRAISNTASFFTAPSAEIEQLQLRLHSLYGSLERGREAFDIFQDVAAKTPATLIQVVNAGAQLKAFGVDAERMIRPITDLAAFMGVDVVEAANSMGRAFAGGQGAADIFRERGILEVIRSFNGIEDLTKTTLPDFRAAMERTLVDPSSPIAGAADRMSQSYTGALSNMGDSITRLRAKIGDQLNPMLADMFRNITSVVETLERMDKADVKAAASITAVNAAAIALVITMNRYRAAQIAAFVQTGVLTTGTFTLAGAFTSLRIAATAANTAIGPVGWAVIGLSAIYTAGTIANQKYADSMIDVSDAFEQYMNLAARYAQPRRPREGEVQKVADEVRRMAHAGSGGSSAEKATEKNIDSILSMIAQFGLDEIELVKYKYDQLDKELQAYYGKNYIEKSGYIQNSMALDKLETAEIKKLQNDKISSALDYYREISQLDQTDTQRQFNKYEVMRSQIQKHYNAGLLSASEYAFAVKTIDNKIVLDRAEIASTELEAARKLTNDKLSAQLAYLQATQPLEQSRIDAQLAIYAQELEAYQALGLSKYETDLMFEAKRTELEKANNEARIAAWKEKNELFASITDAMASSFESSMLRMVQIETNSNNEITKSMVAMVNVMISEITRYIAKLAIAAFWKAIVFGISGGASGVANDWYYNMDVPTIGVANTPNIGSIGNSSVVNNIYPVAPKSNDREYLMAVNDNISGLREDLATVGLRLNDSDGMPLMKFVKKAETAYRAL